MDVLLFVVILAFFLTKDESFTFAFLPKHVRGVAQRRRNRATFLFESSSNASENVGLYVHIPYCRQRCRYCNFSIVPVGAAETERARKGFLDMDRSYRDALLSELNLAKRFTPKAGVRLRSIYFGGGTPSLAPTDTLRKILDAILDPADASFLLEPDAEITIEIDPGTFTVEKLLALKDIGFNRLSLGVQSFDDEILESIGRTHRRKNIFESLEMIHEVYGGGANFSMDLISGLPGLSLAKWAETLERATEIFPKPSHLSLYDLQIESGTVFGQWYDLEDRETNSRTAGRTRGPMPLEKIPKQLPTADDCAFMYRYASGYLRKKGYEHYEISSYALLNSGGLDKRSKHNQIYWETSSEWYSIGLGSSSSIDGTIFARPRTLADYVSWVHEQTTLKQPDWLLPGSETNENDRLQQIVMTRLRTAEGLDLDWICGEKGRDILHAILEGAQLALELGLAERIITDSGSKRLRLKDPDGFLFSNSIISSIFVELDAVNDNDSKRIVLPSR